MLNFYGIFFTLISDRNVCATAGCASTGRRCLRSAARDDGAKNERERQRMDHGVL